MKKPICVCDEGYTPGQDKCNPPKPYFTSEEVSGLIDRRVNAMKVVFKEDVEYGNNKNCD